MKILIAKTKKLVHNDIILNEWSRTMEHFTTDTAAETKAQILDGVNAPYKGGIISTLGGEPTLFLSFSLDNKGDWNHGIFENSRFLRVGYYPNGELVLVCQCHRFTKRFRKSNNNDVTKVINKINKFLTEQDELVTN